MTNWPIRENGFFDGIRNETMKKCTKKNAQKKNAQKNATIWRGFAVVS